MPEDELGTLLERLRALKSRWEEKKPWETADEPSYFNLLGKYKVEIKGKNKLPSDHSIIISTKQKLEVETYQGDGRVSDFYNEIREKLRRQRYKESEQQRREEPKRQEERRKFLEFLGIGE